MPSDDQNMILPLLRSSIPGSLLWDRFRAAERPIFESLPGGLFVSYVFDDPSKYRFISRAICDQMKIDPGQLRQLAITNMLRMNHDFLVNSLDPVYSIVKMNNHESSMILVDLFWDSPDLAAKYIQGDPIVAIPARDMLFFTGSSSQLGIDTIGKMVDKVHSMKDGELLTKSLLIRQNSQWHEYHAKR